MYKIPKNYNVDNLKGERISQISFGINFISFFFSKGYITMEGSFSTQIKHQTRDFAEIYPIKHDFGLLALLEQKIVFVDINDDRTVLTLSFENEFTLNLIGDENYESYTLKINNEEITV